jgi:dTDP-4-dehydrorhamnose reductase
MRILVTGASGQLGAYLLRELRGTEGVSAWSGSTRGQLFGISFEPIDLGDAVAVAAAFHRAQPDAVIHAAARAKVADCFRDPAAAERINAGGTATLAALAREAGARFVLVSTDLVFDGEHAPYREEDAPAPLSVYGKTKAEAEKAAQGMPRAVVARLSLLYGPSLSGRPSFFDEQVRALHAGQPVRLFSDEWRTPLDLATAAQALLALVQSAVEGIIHIGGPERLSRLEMGRRLANFLGIDGNNLVAARRAEAGGEPRPRDTSLDSTRWRGLFPAQPWPALDEALRGLPGQA